MLRTFYQYTTSYIGNFVPLKRSNRLILVPEDIIHPIVSASVLTWFLIEIYSFYIMMFFFLFFFKVLLPRAYVNSVYFGNPVFLVPTSFASFGFQIFLLWPCLVKAITETYRALKLISTFLYLLDVEYPGKYWLLTLRNRYK